MNTAYFTFSFLTIWSMIALSFPDRYLTHSREPLITQAPQIDDHPLFARGDVSTCGYVSGNASMLPSSPSFSPSNVLLTRTTCGSQNHHLRVLQAIPAHLRYKTWWDGPAATKFNAQVITTLAWIMVLSSVVVSMLQGVLQLTPPFCLGESDIPLLLYRGTSLTSLKLFGCSILLFLRSNAKLG